MSEKLRRNLKDAELNEKLAEEGYVIVPMLSSEEVESLKNTFLLAHENQTEAFYASSHNQSSEFRKQMSGAILDVLTPNASKVLEGFDFLGASFISKAAKSESSLQPHQDWNIVDESHFRSFNIWIPLVDLDENNGAIEVLPKSHNWLRGYRHSSINCAYRKVHDLVWENMTPLYLKAGEALIYDHALLHASKANKSMEDRIAIACGVMPSEAEMYFYWNNHGSVEQYESNAEFFMTEDIFSEPMDLKKVRNVPYDFPVIEPDKFYRLIGKGLPLESVKESETATMAVSTSKPEASFWTVYTPMNIIREINYRLTSKK